MLTKGGTPCSDYRKLTLLPPFSLVPGATAAPFTAVYYFVPAVCPFFSPSEGAAALSASLLRQVFLFPMPGHGIFNSVQRTFPA